MTDFSKTWKASKKPTKQRKYALNALLHLRNKLMSAHLSKELKEKHQTRNIPVRTGDKVKVLRGNFKGRTGLVSQVDIKKGKIFIEGIDGVKKDGTKVRKSFVPSNLLILTLNLEDKKRKTKLTKPINAVNNKTSKNKTTIVKENKND